MPKSKRARVVHTSQVQKKPSKERSQTLYQAVHDAVDEYQHIFVFSVENMRNTYLKDIRQTFSDSRLFFGKTKVMAKALGSTEEDEHAPGLRKLGKHLKGNVGLLCTNKSPAEISQYFDEFVQMDYARAGSAATETVVIPEGVVYSTGGRMPQEDDTAIPHSLETTIRKWGMPTRLDKGKVMLDAPYTICKEGKIMSSDQTALLKIFGIATAEFRVRLVAYWSAGSSEVTVLDVSRADNAGPEMDTDEDDE
ncbi:hypothetical protein AMS68_000507 [Peltaster fructicola]|uniref:Ribosome assembly factor mrt4 n=1 Tax=Peltaster fructicola TaxID=286661 RepID=A0A6H0XKF0_9PEZI|nr:hypothetical protein AMS68_000507 [Peltaster fructicola]